MQNNNSASRKSSGELIALATATTKYYEASPDRLEHARVQYEQALYHFNTAQSSVTCCAAGAGAAMCAEPSQS